MIDLKKRRLPGTIKVNGRRYRIHTDFRYFLRFGEHLRDKNTPPDAFDYMYIDNAPPSRLEGVRMLCEFMSPPQTLPRATGKESRELVLDYALDGDYIYAAFMEQYGIDLLEARLHWYQFTALLHGLHDTELNNIISARLYKPSGKNDDYEKEKRKQYEAWRLPQPEDSEDDEALADFLSKLKR